MFRNYIYEYLKIKEEIKSHNNILLGLRKRSNILETEMIKYMKEHNHEGIKITENKILVLENIEPRNSLVTKKNMEHMISVMKNNGIKNPNFLVNEINSTFNEKKNENKSHYKIKIKNKK
jgi:hypothetical protein